MSDPPPIDLSPFRIMVDFLAGGYFALVSIITQSGTTSVLHRIEFSEPSIGNFGLSGDDWFLPGRRGPLIRLRPSGDGRQQRLDGLCRAELR